MLQRADALEKARKPAVLGGERSALRLAPGNGAPRCREQLFRKNEDGDKATRTLASSA
jgi:hypothetical protein